MTKSNINAVIKINRLKNAALTLEQIDNKLSSIEFNEDNSELEYLAKTLASIIAEFGGQVEPPIIEIDISENDIIENKNIVKVLGTSLKKKIAEEQELIWE